MNNAELIAGLRWCADESICCDDFSGEKCPYYDEKKDSCSVDEILHAAADALEAAEKRIDGLQKLVDINTERCEALRKQLREAHKSYEKHINELEAQLPKEGEWITTRTENHDGEIYCSVCDHDAPTEGDYRQVKTDYCPNCGARMDGLRKDNETKLKGE